MKFIKLVLTLILFNGVKHTARAQYITINENLSIENLVVNTLINSPCANVSNISFSGLFNNSQNSIAYFNKNNSSFPFQEGIILSTGSASSAVGPNGFLLSEGSTSWLGDEDLENAIGENNTINATVLEFDFLPLANKVSFEYIFSSEQYLSNPNSNQCNFSDGFAFLLKPANAQEQYQNLAVLPQSSIPVKITTVRGPTPNCPAANVDFFGGYNSFEHPTNFNGQTKILKAEATVEPNVLYHIKLVIADQGNNLYDSAIFLGGGSFKVEKDLGIDRLIATNNPLCENETLLLDATLSGNNSYKWFKNGIEIPNENNATFLVNSTGIYEVEIVLNNTTCIAKGKIEIEYVENPLANSIVLSQCDNNNDGIAIFDLTKRAIDITTENSNWFISGYYLTEQDLLDEVNPIANPTTFENTLINQIIWVKVKNEFGCFNKATITLSTTTSAFVIPEISLCDTTGPQDAIHEITINELLAVIEPSFPSSFEFTFFTTAEEAFLNSNPINSSILINEFENIFVKISENGNCLSLSNLSLLITTFSPENFENEILYLCENDIATLSVPQIFETYQWNNGSQSPELIIFSNGDYTISVTNENGCVASKTFSVIYSQPIEIENIEVTNFNNNNNSATVVFSGNGNYMFALNDGPFQTSPVFENLSFGEYTLFVKDLWSCNTITKTFVILDYPRYFTPNGDGYNETWNIKNLPSQIIISIFNREGRLLKQINAQSNGWDGTINNNLYPSDDYWFSLQLNGKLIKGNFSLKR